MNLTELDEWQGLTADMVREWLKARAPRVTLETDGWWQWGDLRVHVRDSHLTTNPAQSISDIAFCERLSVQALLREINPRMRKGWPSGEALAMHDRWIVSKPEGVVIMCRWRPPYMVNAAGGGDFALREQCEHWSFWPCDEHGNKTRWPVDAEGNML